MASSDAFPFSATRLVDAAIGEKTALSKESLRLAEQVRDESLSLVDRLESYEDIINLEVGDTNLTRGSKHGAIVWISPAVSEV